MTRRLEIGLLLSIFLHFAFLFSVSHKKIETEFRKVEIQIQTAKAKKFFTTTKKGSGGKNKLSRFLPTLPTHPSGDFSPGNYRSGSDDAKTSWGSGAQEFERVEEYPLMSRIQNQVKGLLYYPDVLARHQIEGSVTARLVLDDKGDCNWPLTQISSGNTYFRVYILDLLKKVCKQNFAHAVRGRKQTNVDMSFHFAITEHDDWRIRDEQTGIVGNVLFFYKNSQHSVAQWRLGPLTGLFPMPFVNIDFGWLKENWETYVEKKDPLKEYKGS